MNFYYYYILLLNYESAVSSSVLFFVFCFLMKKIINTILNIQIFLCYSILKKKKEINSLLFIIIRI